VRQPLAEKYQEEEEADGGGGGGGAEEKREEEQKQKQEQVPLPPLRQQQEEEEEEEEQVPLPPLRVERFLEEMSSAPKPRRVAQAQRWPASEPIITFHPDDAAPSGGSVKRIEYDPPKRVSAEKQRKKAAAVGMQSWFDDVSETDRDDYIPDTRDDITHSRSPSQSKSKGKKKRKKKKSKKKKGKKSQSKKVADKQRLADLDRQIAALQAAQDDSSRSGSVASNAPNRLPPPRRAATKRAADSTSLSYRLARLRSLDPLDKDGANDDNNDAWNRSMSQWSEKDHAPRRDGPGYSSAV
jgi:hypothetical protein